MWRSLIIIIFILTACISINTHANAATSLTVTSADKTYTYTLRRDTTLHSIVTSTPLQLFVEGAQPYAVFFRLAPADLRTIYTTLQARIFVDHADAHMIPALVQAPSVLQSIYTTLQARIFVDHADAQFVPVLVPIILDNGIPTGTVARNGTVGTPTSTIHARQQVTATPTTVPTDMPQSVTPMADKGTPSSTVVIESTPEPSATPTMIP